MLLLGGRSGDLLGRRRMFMIGLALFTAGSFSAGIATSFPEMQRAHWPRHPRSRRRHCLAYRPVADRKRIRRGPARNRAFAVYAAVSGRAPRSLLLGGILTNYFSWRWVLFVNVPIGIVLVTGAFLYLHETDRLKGRFDLVGAVLSVGGLVSVVYGFIHVANTSWGNVQTVVKFAAAIVLLLSFVLYEMYGTESPLMPMRIFENRSRSGAYLVMLVVGAAMFGMFYFVSCSSPKACSGTAR